MTRAPALELVERYAVWFARDAASVADDLEQFCQLLRKWNKVQNLVSRETVDRLWQRHIADSLQLLHVLPPHQTVLDLGSGGGFPAIPLAIALKGTDTSFTLVEPIAKKASFLRTAARTFDLSVDVHTNRIEEIDSRETGPVDVITARALASLDTLCAMAAPHFGPETLAIFHKGREHVEELANASARWHYNVVIHSSDTDPNGVLLELKNLRSKRN